MQAGLMYSRGQYKVYVPYSCNSRCTVRISQFFYKVPFLRYSSSGSIKRIFVEYLTFRFAFISQDDLHITAKHNHILRINSTSVEKKNG